MKSENKISSFFNALFTNFHKFEITEKAERTIEKMNPTEKIIFLIFSIIFVISGLMLVLRVNSEFLVEIPALGGTLTEGVIGSPRFINPVLAISDTDKNLSSLIYSGLLKTGEDGAFINDLAESYEIKEGGTIYEFTIKSQAHFHDGKEVTSDDVIFTINKILDPVIKSSKQTSWAGVLAEKIDDKNVRFILSKPYAPFLELLTVGILPKHIWEEASSEEFPFSQFNINPIGSGPYKIKKVERNGGGILTSITLYSFDKYTLGRPQIETIHFKFFQNENDLYKAYRDKSVDSAIGLGPFSAKDLNDQSVLAKDVSLPRIFGLFFNQNTAPVFLNKEVRKALDLSAPKQKIVNEVLYGFGKTINGPTPTNIESTEKDLDASIEEAITLLTENGWKKNEDGIMEKETSSGSVLLSFAITTSDSADLKNTATILKETWEKLGAKVEIKIFESADLSQNIIRSRKYDALLFGEMVGEKTDLYPFWHSSERSDTGLNIAMYTNITVDKALENIRNASDEATRLENTEIIYSEIEDDIPAVFLFSPDLIYLKSAKVKNISLAKIISPSERFLSINEWFIETDKVWKIFAKE